MSSIPQHHEALSLDGPLRPFVAMRMYEHGTSIDETFTTLNEQSESLRVRALHVPWSPYYDFVTLRLDEDDGGNSAYKTFELRLPASSEVAHLSVTYRFSAEGLAAGSMTQALRYQRQNNLIVPTGEDILDFREIFKAYCTYKGIRA